MPPVLLFSGTIGTLDSVTPLALLWIGCGQEDTGDNIIVSWIKSLRYDRMQFPSASLFSQNVPAIALNHPFLTMNIKV